MIRLSSVLRFSNKIGSGTGYINVTIFKEYNLYKLRSEKVNPEDVLRFRFTIIVRKCL